MYDRYRMETDLDEVAKDPRVRSVDFFRTLPKTEVQSAIGPRVTVNFENAGKQTIDVAVVTLVFVGDDLELNMLHAAKIKAARRQPSVPPADWASVSRRW